MAPILIGYIMQEMPSSEDEVIVLIQILKGLECHVRELRSDLLDSWNY